MNKSVKVSANEAGQVVNVSKNNPEYGFIRVSQEKVSFENGWARTRTLSTLISGKVSDLKAIGLHAGQELPGKIVIAESLEPFNQDSPAKDYKLAGNSGVVCTLGGKPIYRRTFYTEDQNVTDVLIAHDNFDEIKNQYNSETSEKISQEEETDL